MMFPKIDAAVFETPAGVQYLREPGVVMIAMPSVDLSGMDSFLGNFAPELEYQGYLDDPTDLPPAETLCKAAGQLCYMSFGPRRTMNKDAVGYFGNIKESKHGSVLEHANFTFLLYGISRSLTHELVRHRAGFGFSQVSQRYVGGKMLRFVERPEYAAVPALHEVFVHRADRFAREYEAMTTALADLQAAGEAAIMSAEQRTDRRKKVRQAARSLLPNETEAPIIVTANVRSWRHFLEMRASEHAETEIRRLATQVHACLREAAPLLFADYTVKRLPDGTEAVSTPYQKV
jgi:thymidylate synthase (FAD)